MILLTVFISSRGTAVGAIETPKSSSMATSEQVDVTALAHDVVAADVSDLVEQARLDVRMVTTHGCLPRT